MTKRRTSPGAVSAPTREDETREAILSTARELLRRYGLRKTTMEDIATAMGKRKSFLYYYFPGKPEVVAAIVEKEYQEIIQAIRAAVGQQSNPADRVRTYFSVRAEQIARRRAEYASDPRFGWSLGEDVVDLLQLSEDRRKFDESEVRYLADLILEGVRSKVFRSLSEKDVLTFCQFALSSLRGTELELFLDPTAAQNLKARLDISFEILFHGLLR